MLLAAALLEAGKAAEVKLEGLPPVSHNEEHLSLELPLIRYAVARQTGGFESALSCLDPIFEQMGTQAVRCISDPAIDEFDRLVGSGEYVAAPTFTNIAENGPLVSVIMTTYNVASYVRAAVRSILEQSYKNLELVIVDDLSTDETPGILKELERTDPRVRVVLKSTNDGTYVSKNIGILHSLGEIIALQDADDWSHPDRIAVSVSSLLSEKKLVGLTTDWFRMTSVARSSSKQVGRFPMVAAYHWSFEGPPSRRSAFLIASGSPPTLSTLKGDPCLWSVFGGPFENAFAFWPSTERITDGQ
ncbi:hypothetical protein AJ87_24250 [Rhizobium yanglingense]|nr:hypothetical protein AJ87_24250 [Rhizobium yanglingense]